MRRRSVAAARARRELVAWKPDVIVAVTTPAAIAAKNATSSIPVVFVGRRIRSVPVSWRTSGGPKAT